MGRRELMADKAEIKSNPARYPPDDHRKGRPRRHLNRRERRRRDSAEGRDSDRFAALDRKHAD